MQGVCKGQKIFFSKIRCSRVTVPDQINGKSPIDVAEDCFSWSTAR